MNLESEKYDRRDFVPDEKTFYCDLKARPFFTKVCADKNWNIIKGHEDFKEDFVININNIDYYIEAQVAGHWHNFDLDKIVHFFINKNKADNLKERNTETSRGTLIFTNCVPNRWVGFNVNLLKEEWVVYDKKDKEYSY